MNKFLFMWGLPMLAIAQMSTFQINHYLNPTNATVREVTPVDLSRLGGPFSLEVGLMKSASMVSGRGQVEADFSLFPNPLLDFDGDDFEWNTATLASSTRLSARVFHPSCYGIIRDSDLNAVQMGFISELKGIENYNPASVIMAQYMVIAQRVDVATDGITQTKQSSTYAAQTPLTLIVGSPAQNDQGIYDVTITLTDPSGEMLPFNLARVGSPGFCIDNDGVESDDTTRLIAIPAQASSSFLLSNVIAGSWSILLDSLMGMRNQTYNFTSSVVLKSANRPGWKCGVFGYCSLASQTRSNFGGEGSTVSNPTVIADNSSPATQTKMASLLVLVFIFLSYF